MKKFDTELLMKAYNWRVVDTEARIRVYFLTCGVSVPHTSIGSYI